MKVSIIMPTFNDEKFISQSINSVLEQTYTNWELLIMDDGSRDNTSSVVISFNDERIRLFHQENKGQLVALNNLCPYISGDLVLMLHSDDRLYNERALENNLRHFSDSSIDGVYSDFYQFFNSGKPDKVLPVSHQMGKKAINKLTTRLGSNIIIDHFFVRREAFENQVKYNYLKWYLPYWLNFTGNNITCLNLKYTSSPWYHYRVHDQNYTNSVIGNFEVYFTRFRSVLLLSEYLTVPFPLIQKEISRRFNFSGIVFRRKASDKHLAKCYRANLRSMKTRTPGAYTRYFKQLIHFLENSSGKTLEIESPVDIAYTAADARKFYTDLQNNTLAPIYSEIISDYEKGFRTIQVKNESEREILSEILKFLCIRARIKVLRTA